MGQTELCRNEQGELALTPIWQSGACRRPVASSWSDVLATAGGTVAASGTDEAPGTDVVYLHTGQDTEPFYPGRRCAACR